MVASFALGYRHPAFPVRASPRERGHSSFRRLLGNARAPLVGPAALTWVRATMHIAETRPALCARQLVGPPTGPLAIGLTATWALAEMRIGLHHHEAGVLLHQLGWRTNLAQCVLVELLPAAGLSSVANGIPDVHVTVLNEGTTKADNLCISNL